VTSPPTIAVVKPDWGVRGGFEIVLDRVIGHLRASGNLVHELAVPARRSTDVIGGHRVSQRLSARASEVVDYLDRFARFEALDTHRADVVISTQPPSFATRADRHLSIFYHHARLFYDLAPLAVGAGLLDAELADTATDHVRRIDARALAQVSWFLAGSEHVRRRLSDFNGIERSSLFLASTVHTEPRERSDTAQHVLCVSRHEFPKRTELFVDAMADVAVRGICVGAGGRLGWIKDRAHAVATGVRERSDDDWRLPHRWTDPAATPEEIGNVRFVSHVSDAEIGRLYSEAYCVVAPAHDEDYGLTALEAMQHGIPVVVCDDGGGLTELVTHEVNGLIVAPTAAAISGAIGRLTADVDLRVELGEAGRSSAGQYTWERAFEQLDLGLDRVLAS
jgi:glycosyltransferase involved in cell wall biosynthesis